MTIRKLSLLVALCAAFAFAPAFGQEVAPAKRAEIENLLKTTGALQLGQQFASVMVQQLVNSLRATHANIPQKALEVLPEEVNHVIADNMGTLKELMIQIYDKHFTLADLQGLNKFYATDLGRKLVASLPEISQEGMLAGQKWGQQLGPEIGRRVQARFKEENITL